MAEAHSSNSPVPAPADAVRTNALLDEVNSAPTIVAISRAARALSGAAASAPVRIRLGCVSSFTIDPLKDAIALQGLRAGFGMEIHVAPFGQVDQALIDPASSLAVFAPDAVIVAARLQDICPDLYESYNGLSQSAAQQLIDDWIGRLSGALKAFRTRSLAHVLIQNFDLPASLAMGIADAGAANSQMRLIRRANDTLRELAGGLDNVYVMDYDSLVATHGRRTWADARTSYYASIPVAPAHYWKLAGFYVRHLRPLFGLGKKVIVLDADNTLWGGVVGDVGAEGIALGHAYPGSAFVAFQRRLLDLYHRGVVLCIASKNEPGAVEEVLKSHPSMVLREEHFAARRVDWNPKPQNIEAMAHELNLGVDSFVFVDDSPVECDLVRQALPQVMTVCLPREPAEYPAAIESLDCFDQWSISSEDRRRGEMYRAEAGRRGLQTAAVDMPTFYRQLDMVMTLAVNDRADVARAAQMTARTNQFNMHTLRLTEDDIRRFMDSSDHRVVSLALSDRFGDNGVVGLAVVRVAREEWTLHMYLMSCRVLGRTVEQSFVKWIGARARAAGARRLCAEFVQTAKNKPFAGFYPSFGFSRDGGNGAVQRWTLALTDADMTIPDWLKLNVQPSGEIL